MTVQIITQEDLQLFKTELIRELREVISKPPTQPRKWMKSYKVRKILDISAGTLQTMRANGTLSYTKIGGLIYYDATEIDQMLTNLKKAS